MLRVVVFAGNVISIHALREEGDARVIYTVFPGRHISIHALREEGDQRLASQVVQVRQFQSTPSARRATRRSA